MQYAWIPHNTISVVVREVVKAIIEEYTHELLFCPTTEQGWRHLADKWYQRLSFPHTVQLMASKWPEKPLVTLAQNVQLQRIVQCVPVCHCRFTYIDL
jgi:hypothetical protein